MTQYPVVTVMDVTNASQVEEKGKELVLGDPKIDAIVNDLVADWRGSARKIFHLKWEGSKIPRGAMIEGSTIQWTQNGEVVSSDGKTIGTYQRLVEFGGASGNEQQMLIFVL